VAAPQTDQEYQAALESRAATLEQIRRIQAAIDQMGFLPADTAKHNQLLADRLRLTKEQQAVEADIRRADPGLQQAANVRQQAQERLRQLRDERQLAREQSAVLREARSLDLRQRYPVSGAAIARIEQGMRSPVGRALGNATLAAGATVGGMVQRGFSGTVEQNRLDFEMQLLSREFASAFKPIIELLTTGVTKVRRFMEGLDESGQNLVMIGGMLAGAYGTARVARMAGGLVSGLGGMAAGAGGMSALVGGAAAGGAAAMAGGTAAAAAGGMNMAALGATSALAVGGGTAATQTAARAGFWGRARALGSKMPGWGKVAAIGATVVAGNQMREGQDSQEFRSRHGANADELDRLEGEGTDALLNRYRQMRANRGTFSKVTSWIGGGAGYAGQERDTIEETERRLMARGVTPETGKRRDVTPNDFGYEEVGSAYRRASIGSLGVNTSTDDGTGRSVTDMAQGIIDRGRQAGQGMSGETSVVDLAKSIMEMTSVLEMIAKNTEKKTDVR
jgi:hypothetical protein